MVSDEGNGNDFRGTLEELNQQLAGWTHSYNTTPDPEMGFLSPEQVTRLIYGDWGSPDSAIQFQTDVPLAELEASDFFRHVRGLLMALQNQGGTKATTSKNLTRRFVAEMVEQLFTKDAQNELYRFRKTLNEQDVWPLHLARVVAQAAGFVRYSKGRFTVPKTKSKWLTEERAGALFGQLLVAHFRKFNLAYSDGLAVEAHGLQVCAGYSLYRVGFVAKDWRLQDASLADKILLPSVRDEIAGEIESLAYWSIENVVRLRLLRPFHHWGLLDEREEHAEKCRTDTSVRISPLYQRFLRFEL